MCGRYTFYAGDEMFGRFSLDPSLKTKKEISQSFNATPGQFVPVIVGGKHFNELKFMRWGLIPSWAKEAKIGFTMFNARAESISEKPTFKTAFRRRRCLVPANGFFEWKKENKKSIPFYYSLKDQPIFSFAGIYDEWMDPNGSELESYTIITTTPNDLIKKVHDRMPVILSINSEKKWLDFKSAEKDLSPLLKPYPSALMDFKTDHLHPTL